MNIVRDDSAGRRLKLSAVVKYRMTFRIRSLKKASGPFLYKYSSLDGPRLGWLRAILLDHQIYFPSPEELNDKIDARPPLRVTSKERAFQRLLGPHLAGAPGDAATAYVELRRLVDRADENALSHLITRSFHQEMEQHRIYSMSVRPDNEHLWTEYSGRHTGYCLEFANEGMPFGLAHEIIYGEAPVLDFNDDADFEAAVLFCKTTEPWHREEEVRVVLFPRNQPKHQRFDPTLLRRVILGRDVSATNEQTIRSWCEQRDPKLEVVIESVAAMTATT